MKPSFNLAEHRRWPQPLSAPPAGYFDQLPTRVMSRLPRPEARTAAWPWWAQLPIALRTGLASTAVLAGFASSFWLSSHSAAPGTATAVASLNAVPRTELVSYLLTSGVRVENSDLAVLTAADPDLPKAFMHTSAAEVDAVLDEQPADESAYL